MNSRELHAIADLLEQLDNHDAIDADVTRIEPEGYDVELGITLTDEALPPTPDADQSSTPVKPTPDDEDTTTDPDTTPAPDEYNWDGETAVDRVRTVLDDRGELSGTEIIQLTELEEHTTYKALSRMDDLAKRKDPDDGRRNLYQLGESESLPGDSLEDRLQNLPDDADDWPEQQVLDRLGVARHTLTARLTKVSEATTDHDVLEQLSSIAETVGDDVQYCGLCGTIAFGNTRLMDHHGRVHGDPSPCFHNELPDTLVVDDGYWCGVCGDGPWGDAPAVEAHHDDTHGKGSAVALEAEPSDEELEEAESDASTKYTVADGGGHQARRTVADVIDQTHVYRLSQRNGTSAQVVHVDEDCDGFNRADRAPTQKPAAAYPVGSVELCTRCTGPAEETDD